MGTQDRREREKRETREKILDAARTLFVERGFESVSLRSIADAIEYSPAAIYVHFADKDALFYELCCHDFARLASVFTKLASVSDPIERIRQCGLQYIRFAVQNPHHYQLMFMTRIRYTEADREALINEPRRGDPEQDAYAFLHHAVDEAMRQKRFRPELKDAALVTQTLWAAVHGVSALEVTHSEDPWIAWAKLESRASVMCDTILRGLVRADNGEKRR